MSRALRVVHVPARTPYVRKIVSDDFSILNGADTGHGLVPDAVTASWLLDRRPLDWLDVLHLHHIEFDDLATLQRLLIACAESSVKVVYTAHDVTPMYCTSDDFAARMSLLIGAGVSWVGLTAESVDALRRQFADLPPVALVPHGYVVGPDELAERTPDSRSIAAPRYLLYGALRPSRDHLATISNWSVSITDPTARLRLLLRAFSPADFDRQDVPALMALINSDQRIEATMRAYPSDAEIVDAGLGCDAILLPYLHGTHSGQLELAFDLNLLPVCSSVGHIKDQYRIHGDLVGEPIWFDWSDGHPFLHGEKFVAALESANARLRSTSRRGPSREFMDYRRQEHRDFLDAHRAVYSG